MNTKWCFTLMVAGAVLTSPAWSEEPATGSAWTKKVVWEGGMCYTAAVSDFTKDGVPDIIADMGEGVTRLFVGPDWEKVVTIDGGHSSCGNIDKERLETPERRAVQEMSLLL